MEQKIDEVFYSNSWILYLDAMKSPLTRYKYQGNLARFLDFAEICGITLEERAEKFADCGKKIQSGHFRIFSDSFTPKRKELSRSKSVLQQLEIM